MTDLPHRSDAPLPLLRRWSRGPAVRLLRERLRSTRDLGPGAAGGERGGEDDARVLVTGLADDVFDEATDEAVRAFQQRRGLIVDGLVGPHTQAALESSRWTLGDRLVQFTPGHLVRGDDVEDLQQRLLGLGFALGRVDGIFGPETDQAVRTFQRSCGLTPDGSVGPQTLRAFDGLRRSVTGGAPNSLRERELVRRSGASLAGRTIVLDPGHGGDDRGAEGFGLAEADVALDLARRIEGRLSAHGVSVLFTRAQHTAGGTDEERATFANDCHADLVLSLHCDRSDRPGPNGVASFYYGNDRHGAHSAVGAHLADLIQRETIARTGLTDCRTHARAWSLLQHTKMPTVRVEVGYLSNPEDAARLADPTFRDDVAEAVVVAVQRMYLGDDDVASTGLLRLGDLRRLLESMAG